MPHSDHPSRSSADSGRLFYDRLRERRPEINEQEARAIASIWAEEQDLIISRMFEISEEQVGIGLHVEARTAAIFELSKLLIALTEQAVEKKLDGGMASDPLTAESEQAMMNSEHGKERIENTARILAEHIWNKLMARWRERWPLIVDPTDSKASRKIGRQISAQHQAPVVRDNHFSPVFSNKQWANANGRVRRYYRTGSGAIGSRDTGPKGWGYEKFLYSHRLEQYLQLVDSDGAESCRKILHTEPLTDLDKRRWIAFLIVQMLRTPGFMYETTEHLKSILPRIAPDYPSTPGALKAAYETMFTNNDLYARFHRQIGPLSWSVLVAPNGIGFIRPDTTIVTHGNPATHQWQVIYPMTPERVFIAGPETGNGYEQDFVPSIAVDTERVMKINRVLASIAMKSVISQPEQDSPELRTLLDRDLCTHGSSQNISRGTGVLWGPLSPDHES